MFDVSYRLGSFETAIECHEERLKIAQSQGDLQAERRAYTNLGNANVFLEKYASAIEFYLKGNCRTRNAKLILGPRRKDFMSEVFF